VPASFFERHPTFRALAHRDYRLLLAGSALVSLVAPFQFLTQVFWVQAEYPGRSVLYTALISASRGVAMLLFALIGGAIADRFERRRVLLATECTSFSLNAVVALLMLTSPLGGSTIGGVIACTFLAAGVGAIDSPARTASLPAIVGMGGLANAISLNMMVSQLMLPISLPLVGVLNDAFEPGQVYAGSLVAWAAIIPLISMLRYRSVGGLNRGLSMVANIREGISYTRASATISGVLSIVIVVQLLGMPVATPLGPVFFIKDLGFTNAQVGLMGMTWGLGAMTSSFLLARLNWLTLRGSTLVAAVVLNGIGIIGLGYSRYIPLTAAADFAFGFAFTATLLTASTIVQHAVADQMRGRVMGLFPFAAGFAYVATAPIGAAGQRLGLALMIPALGWASLALCGLVVSRRPAILRVRPPGEAEPALVVPSSPAG
jgi:MFS family permease